MQSTAFFFFIVLSLITAAGFIFAAHSGKYRGEYPAAASMKIRKLMFIGFLIAIGIFLGLTLPGTPYPSDSEKPDRVVHVTIKQFLFEMSDNPIGKSESGDAPAPIAMAPVKKGELVEFRVTSGDVNHGLGIYTNQGKILTQAQAMPGYVNRLRHRFTEAGGFPILCMEYCGVGHHAMKTVVNVVE